MRARIATSVVLAAAVLFGTAGCNFLAPQATTYHYFASDGVNADAGELDIRNAVIISDKGVLGNLVMTVVNNGERASLNVQFEGSGGTQNVTVSVPSGTTVFGPQDGKQVLLRQLGTKPGAVLPVYFQTGDSEGEQVEVPVLDGGLPEYADLLPIDVIIGPQSGN